MPSPFPGMDPFLEGPRWPDFHHEFISALRAQLVPQVRPRYVIHVERRVYLEHKPNGDTLIVRPDVTILEDDSHTAGREGGNDTVLAVASTPTVLTLPIPERVREAFLTMRERETEEVVTVIEFLSPGNKRSSGDGQREYLDKRESVLLSATHLVELDLLRGGERLPVVEPLPPADYYAFVSRASRRPRVEVYPWSLRRPMPSIDIPLAGDDPDVTLDLQAAFNTVYDRTGYDYSLDYQRDIVPPLSDEDTEWVRQTLAG